MVIALRKAIREHRISIFFFFYTVVYNILISCRLSNYKIDDITFAYHLVDYSFGFRFGLLPGAIYGTLFHHNYSTVLITIYCTVLLILFFAGVAYLLEKFVISIDSKYRNTAFLLVAFYLSGPFSFSIFARELGMLDFYWIASVLLFCVFIQKKYFRMLIPLLCAACLLVHFSSVISYLLMMLTLILYRISIEDEKKEQKRYIMVFIISAFLVLCLFIALFYVQSCNVASISMEEFHNRLESRGSSYSDYYDYAYYNLYRGQEVIDSSIYSIDSPIIMIIKTIFGKISFTFYEYSLSLKEFILRFIVSIVLFSPAVLFIYKRFIVLLKDTKNNLLKKFCILVMMMQFPITAIIGSLFSADIFRWMTHAFLIFSTDFLILLKYEKSLREQTFNSFNKIKCAPLTIYVLSYFSTVFWPYC